MTEDPQHPRAQWRGAMEATPDCLTIERLMADLTPEERGHLDHCARCQTERALAIEFEQDRPGADEADVESVMIELRRRLSATRPAGRSRGSWLLSPWLQLAAGVVLAAGLGYVAWDREPALGNPDGETYRSDTVVVVGPMGDFVEPPSRFEWVRQDGATQYRISVREVDGTLVWSTTTAGAFLEIPTAVLGVLVPGKTLVWDIIALDAGGAMVARSSEQRFRIGGRPPGK